MEPKLDGKILGYDDLSTCENGAVNISRVAQKKKSDFQS
jgi:hypothetical protein